jgi:outer membrane protein assembly factor BamB
MGDDAIFMPPDQFKTIHNYKERFSMLKKLSFQLVFLTLGLILHAQQWRGEMRDGIFRKETGLLQVWPKEGPRLLLKVDNLGKGYASPIPANKIIYITGMKDTLDYLTAIDYQGNIKWQVSYGRSWNNSFPETRCSPTIEGDKVYVLSGTGRLSCFQCSDGTVIWSVDVDKDYESERHLWGVAESPLIVDNLVICSPGGKKTSIIALDKLTGKEIWRTGTVGGQRAYISPTLYDYNNIRYILAATATNLIAIVPETGKVAWSYQYWNPDKWDQPGLIWANTPIWYKDEIFISMGYDYQAVMLKMNADGSGVTEKYRSDILDNHHHGLVLVDGYVYGSNWINNGKGNWVCMNWDTGKIMWETEWENKGNIVYADGFFYLYEEKRGNVGLVKPNPDKLDLVCSFRNTEGTGPHWAHPFIGDKKLFIRHGEVLTVYDISQ